MCDRVNRYYQKLASAGLLNRIRSQLTGDYLRIFDDLRDCTGSTQLHADRLGMDAKTYNRLAGEVGRKCVDILIDLAEIGVKTIEKT